MLSWEFKDLDLLRAKFGPKIVKQSLNSAMNKTTAKAKTFISKEVRKKYDVKAKAISKVLTQISIKDPVAERVLIYTGSNISLINFGARQVRVAGGKRKGTSVRIKKAGGRKTIKGPNRYGAFIAKGANSNRHVFMRETKERDSIEKLSGPSIPGMISQSGIGDSVDLFVQKEMPQQLDRALDYFLTKAGAI